MKFTDVGFVTDDVPRLQAFYEAVFGGKAEGNKHHAQLTVDGMGLTFLAQKNTAFYYERMEGASNIILTFNTDDVDAKYQRLISLGAEVRCEPKTHPWGARSFQISDPDGNILNFRSIPRGNEHGI
jgi:uncharacterized glyoxalase superfamily protein PhnB